MNELKNLFESQFNGFYGTNGRNTTVNLSTVTKVLENVQKRINKQKLDYQENTDIILGIDMASNEINFLLAEILSQEIQNDIK